jgi:hypothetical protein
MALLLRQEQHQDSSGIRTGAAQNTRLSLAFGEQWPRLLIAYQLRQCRWEAAPGSRAYD